MKFQASKKLKKHYNRIFRENPEAANLFLLLCELANTKGRVITDEGDLACLMDKRFKNPKEYALRSVADE